MDIFSIPSACLKVEQKTNCATIIEKEFMHKKMNREFKFVELMEGGFGF